MRTISSLFIIILLSALFCVESALAQSTTQCNMVGNSMSCFTSPSAADIQARREAKQQRQNQQALQECLRKADWPGSPSQAECRQMYGN